MKKTRITRRTRKPRRTRRTRRTRKPRRTRRTRKPRKPRRTRYKKSGGTTGLTTGAEVGMSQRVHGVGNLQQVIPQGVHPENIPSSVEPTSMLGEDWKTPPTHRRRAHRRRDFQEIVDDGYGVALEAAGAAAAARAVARKWKERKWRQYLTQRGYDVHGWTPEMLEQKGREEEKYDPDRAGSAYLEAKASFDTAQTEQDESKRK